MTQSPLVSVIVPARDASATLQRTLECLAAQNVGGPYEVIVVDSGSSDDTPAVAERAGVRVLRLDGASAGEGRNAGVEAASAPAIAFTDSDCYPEPGWLAAGLSALAGADVVQGRVEPEEAVDIGPFDRTLRVSGAHGLYETANLFIRRELFQSLGGFRGWSDEPDERPFGEDVWLGWRARRDGARVAFCEDAVVRHAVFRRGVADYVRERMRRSRFPALVRQVPELRREFLFGRLFLDRRSAALDLGLGSAIAAAAAGAPLLCAGAAPYLVMLGTRALRWRRLAPRVIAGDLAADVVGLAALLTGSLRSRSLVL